MRRRRQLAGGLAALTLAGAAALALGGGAAAADRTSPCTGWASPTGSDSNPGTRSRPYRTVARLASSLRPGQAGCLEPATIFPEHVVIEATGARRAPIVIRTGPGPRAVLSSGLQLTQTARYVRVENVAIRARTGTGSENATVTVRGFEIAFVGNDISGGADVNVPRACVLVDHAGHPVLEGNEIHHCGPRGFDELYAAGIRVGIAVNARIADNVIFGNPGDAIALAPNAQRTVVSRNLLVDNSSGVFFGGSGAFVSRDNRVTRNVIVLSRRYAVHGSYKEGNPIGSGNIVFENCLWRVALVAGVGFTEARSRIANPEVRWTGSTYRLKAGSPCAGYGPPV
jgi:Right handed beta helix region